MLTPGDLCTPRITKTGRQKYLRINLFGPRNSSMIPFSPLFLVQQGFPPAWMTLAGYNDPTFSLCISPPCYTKRNKLTNMFKISVDPF